MRTIPLILLLLLFVGCSCEDKNGNDLDGSTDADVPSDAGDAGDGAQPPVCQQVTESCATEACCSGLICDAVTTECSLPNSVCAGTNEACTLPSDCCSGSCISDACAPSCKTNTTQCASNFECCSGVCNMTTNVCQAAPGGGACTTVGQGCSVDANCCSRNCINGFCALTGASCMPQNDTCYRHSDCCSNRCSQNDSGVGGVCLPPALTSGSCRMAGEVCDSCANCCSRTCVPTAAGAMVCLRASGCVIEGELCDTTADCCGAPPQPGGVGTQTCVRNSPSDPFGRCVLSGTTPDGNVCKSATPWCEASIAPSNCGNCGSPKAQCCRIDPNGTPRCFGGSTVDCPAGYDGNDPNCCIAAGEMCNFTGECCGNNPCLPDNQGVYRCGAMCSEQGQACRTSGDCCLGLACNVPVGETLGTCEPPTPPPPADAGVDASTPPVCAQLGQGCSASQACCFGYVCNSQTTGQGCTGQTDCSCFPVGID